MSILTPLFNLFKLQKTDGYDITQFNANMDIIDEQMAKPPLTVNEIEPDPETRNLKIDVVPLADNFTSDEAQINSGLFIARTSGGEASIADGPAWLSSIHGNQVKTGYVAESLNLTVTNAEREQGVEGISATIDRDTFVEAVSASGTITLTYTTDWSADPATYGVTVTGTPISGDVITIVYVKENRGLITTANPTSFVSTGWNLYNHSVGYARVVNYSEEYGFMIDGTYTGLKFSETLSGEQTTITPVDGYFTVPADGYVFVTGGNSTDTMIWMTWSDWTEEPNGGVFAAYSQTSIDLTGVMTNFPDGLMRIGNAYDEINLNTLRAYSRIQKLEYTDENLENVIALGLPYDTDANYIYAVRQAAVAYTISIDGEYSVSDHGMEIYLGTSIPVYSTSLYGNDLKGKLRRDVLTISQQTLSAAQKTQVQDNIGVTEQVAALNSKIANPSTYTTFSAMFNNFGANSYANGIISTGANDAPTSTGEWFVEQYKRDTNYGHQFARQTNTSELWFRRFNTGTWGDWGRIGNLTADKISSGALTDNKKPGLYFYASATDSPDGSNGFLLVMNDYDNHYKQIWFPYRTPGSNDGHIYIRASTNGNYVSSWWKFTGELVTP